MRQPNLHSHSPQPSAYRSCYTNSIGTLYLLHKKNSATTTPPMEQRQWNKKWIMKQKNTRAFLCTGVSDRISFTYLRIVFNMSSILNRGRTICPHGKSVVFRDNCPRTPLTTIFISAGMILTLSFIPSVANSNTSSILAKRKVHAVV